MTTTPLSRRTILRGSAGLLALPRWAAPSQAGPERVYFFATPDYDVRMTLEFYDRYQSQGFRFKERSSERYFCMSSAGEENRNCLQNFTGSIAIARYRILSHNGLAASLPLREYVRNIDRSDPVPERAPFEREIETQGGLASDIQAFGYEHSPGLESGLPPQADQVWFLLRQDLFLKDKAHPFLVVHWKHTLGAIRVLDIIPGAGTARVSTGRRHTG